MKLLGILLGLFLTFHAISSVLMDKENIGKCTIIAKFHAVIGD